MHSELRPPAHAGEEVHHHMGLHTFGVNAATFPPAFPACSLPHPAACCIFPRRALSPGESDFDQSAPATSLLRASTEVRESRGIMSSSLTTVLTYPSISTHRSSDAQDGHAYAQQTAPGTGPSRNSLAVRAAIPAPRECPVTTGLKPVSAHLEEITAERLSTNHLARPRIVSSPRHASRKPRDNTARCRGLVRGQESFSSPRRQGHALMGPVPLLKPRRERANVPDHVWQRVCALDAQHNSAVDLHEAR